MSQKLSEQEIIRRENLEKIRELGIDPYPGAAFDINTTTKDIIEGDDADVGNFQDVTIAGRFLSRRIMGKASFGEIQVKNTKTENIIAAVNLHHGRCVAK